MPVYTTSPSLPTSADPHDRNIRPELCAESWFFLENTNYSQFAGNQFGVLNDTVFRTTSLIQYTGKVYTICSGQVFIQPHGNDSTKINLILKPFRQPVNGLPIKYIIYRGLKKDNFFDSNDIVLGEDDPKATGLTKRIRKEFADFYANNSALTKPPFKAWLIGFPNPNAPAAEQQSGDDYIDEYFFKMSNPDNLTSEPEKKAFELPMIPGGTYIGDAQGTLGIDIVLNEGDFTIENDPNPFKLTLSYALATDYRLETANSNTDFLKKLIRESATQFIDIAAFYGMHAQGKGKVHTQSGLTTNPDTIYALIGNFLTKNTVYLYIQSNRQRSYNFYGNYDLNGNNFKIGFDLSNLIEKKFGTESWPIEEISNVGAQQDKLYLKFLHSREFNIPALCSFNKNLENTTSVYFANREELIDTNSTNPIGYTNEIEVSLEKVNNYQISEPIFIGYLGNYFGIDNYQDFPLSKKSNYFLLHSIFSLVDTKSNLIQDEGSISILEYHKTSPIALLSYKDVFLVGSKVITDFGEKLITPNNSVSKRRKTFISHILRIPDNLNLKNSRFFNPNNLSLKSSKEKIFEFIYGEKEFSLNSFLLTENGVDFKTLSLKYNDAIINEYFHLGITNEEFEILKQLIPAQAYSVRFKFNDETNYNMDFENDVVFYKFSLGIIYENSLGNLEEIFPSLPINVYGIKINFLASKEYADFENKAFEKQDIL